MEKNSLNTGLAQLKKWHEERNTLRFSLVYQRKAGQWSPVVRSLLIWSVLTGSYVPPLVFLKEEEDLIDEKGKPMSVYSVLDGLQRLSNCFSFMNDEWRIHGSCPDVDIDGETYELSGKLFSELPQELQNLINSYKFSIAAISHATEDEATMLYANINAGKELSVIAKAKPKLGVVLCEYVESVREKSFIAQGLHLSTSQALKEEDIACILQSLMLITEEYDEYKSLSVAECFKFAEWLHNNVTERMKTDFAEIIDYLSVYTAKTKYLRKNNVSCIVKLAEQMMLEGISAKDYKSFLDGFFSSENEEYKEFSGVGNVKRPNVEGRYGVLMRECYQHFNLELPSSAENDEVNSDTVSPEGTDASGAGFDGSAGNMEEGE